jgi:hypothetical protein
MEEESTRSVSDSTQESEPSAHSRYIAARAHRTEILVQMAEILGKLALHFASGNHFALSRCRIKLYVLYGSADCLLHPLGFQKVDARARNPPEHHSGVFRSYRLHRQLAAFQKRFRLLEFPLAEIRPEFDRNASDAGTPP